RFARVQRARGRSNHCLVRRLRHALPQDRLGRQIRLQRDPSRTMDGCLRESLSILTYGRASTSRTYDRSGGGSRCGVPNRAEEEESEIYCRRESRIAGGGKGEAGGGTERLGKEVQSSSLFPLPSSRFPLPASRFPPAITVRDPAGRGSRRPGNLPAR